MAFRKLLVLVLLLGVSACKRVDDDFIVPAGHPADPAARPGIALSDSGALRPELRTVSPQAAPSAAPKTPSQAAPSHKHGQHKH